MFQREKRKPSTSAFSKGDPNDESGSAFHITFHPPSASTNSCNRAAVGADDSRTAIGAGPDLQRTSRLYRRRRWKCACGWSRHERRGNILRNGVSEWDWGRGRQWSSLQAIPPPIELASDSSLRVYSRKRRR